jgi:hypothetical protein
MALELPEAENVDQTAIAQVRQRVADSVRWLVQVCGDLLRGERSVFL